MLLARAISLLLPLEHSYSQLMRPEMDHHQGYPHQTTSFSLLLQIERRHLHSEYTSIFLDLGYRGRTLPTKPCPCEFPPDVSPSTYCATSESPISARPRAMFVAACVHNIMVFSPSSSACRMMISNAFRVRSWICFMVSPRGFASIPVSPFLNSTSGKNSGHLSTSNGTG